MNHARIRACSLIYHDIVAPGGEDTSGFASEDARFYKLPARQFTEHLDAISRVRPSGTSRPDDVNGGDGELLFVTFDDGGVAAIERTAGLLESRRWHGVFFVTTGSIGTAGFLSQAQVRELADRGHAVGSHSATHPPRMSALPIERIEAEWRESRARLEDCLGREVTLASLPGGYYSRGVASAASRAGIRMLWTSEPTTRPWRVDDCLVLGRFGTQRIHTAAHIEALVADAGLARRRQAFIWLAKKAAKRAGGSTLLSVRARLFAMYYRGKV